jgi:tetratricopeptide (TPR) repeat protein
MKKLMLILLLLIPAAIYGQQMTYDKWEKEALTDKGMLPKYGNLPKNDEELKADSEFLNNAIELDSTAEKASAHMVDLGFQFLYDDPKIAMYRFNLAYLLDSTNSDVYWGYGAVFFIFNRLDLTREQYEIGLALNPDNTRLLTDYGTTYMSEYFINQDVSLLDKAISIISRSYIKDPTNQNTSYKLASCYLMKSDCENTRKFYDACMSFGGTPITEEFKAAINIKCK